MCAVALVGPGFETTVDGRMAGRLIRKPRGANGFGYDPIFVPDGYDVTSAELDSARKDAISHRGRALRALLPVLVERLGVRSPGNVRRAGGPATVAPPT